MKFIHVTLTLVALTGYAVAVGSYGSGGGSGGGGSYGGGRSSAGGAASYGGGGAGSGGRGQGSDEAPRPYSFDYNAADGQGNVHYRNEQGDERGSVRGTYGYTDAQGLYRVVEYVADENGFRANIRTNEPGVDGKESPADVVLTAEEPPAGIQNGGGAGGYGGAGSAPRSYSGGSGGAAKPRGGKSGY